MSSHVHHVVVVSDYTLESWNSVIPGDSHAGVSVENPGWPYVSGVCGGRRRCLSGAACGGVVIRGDRSSEGCAEARARAILSSVAGSGAARLARSVRDAEVGGSNPLSPTLKGVATSHSLFACPESCEDPRTRPRVRLFRRRGPFPGNGSSRLQDASVADTAPRGAGVSGERLHRSMRLWAWAGHGQLELSLSNPDESTVNRRRRWWLLATHRYATLVRSG